MRNIYSEIIDGIEYRFCEIQNRGKLISKYGDAINPIKRNQFASAYENKDGYLCFGGGIPVHQYVAHAWVDGWFEGAEVNHKDFNRHNNCADNLEWVTHQKNIEYTIKNNYEVFCNSKKCEKNGRSKFLVDDVYKIRFLYDNGMKIADIVRLYFPELDSPALYKNIHSTISAIARRKTWNSLPEIDINYNVNPQPSL